VLRLREFYGLLPDVDLKECYFEKAWGFRKDEFVLAGWRESSVKDLKWKVRGALPDDANGRHFYPPCKVDVDALDSKEAIVRAFWELTYVPASVYETAVGGAHVLGLVEAGKVGENPNLVGSYLWWACRAGLDASVIRGLAGKCGEEDINDAARWAAWGGHTDVFDLLASEFRARIDVECLIDAASWGQDAMIDHLVERYGLDPNAVDGDGWTALHLAAHRGRVRTVQHLVEKYNVDIRARDGYGKTALDLAKRNGRTEIASYLRELGATNGIRAGATRTWTRTTTRARTMVPTTMLCNRRSLCRQAAARPPGSIWVGAGRDFANPSLGERRRRRRRRRTVDRQNGQANLLVSVQRGFLRVDDTYASVEEEQGEGREAGREDSRR
jgi:hypothetical protein